MRTYNTSKCECMIAVYLIYMYVYDTIAFYMYIYNRICVDVAYKYHII